MNAEQRRRTRLAFEDLRAELKADHQFYNLYEPHSDCYQARRDMIAIALDKLEIWRRKPEGYLRHGLLKTLYLLQSLREGYGNTINKYRIPEDNYHTYAHKQLTVTIHKIEDTLSYLAY